MKPPRYALMSVYDKTNVIDLATALVTAGYTIIATGGTAKTLQQHKIVFTPIQEITGNPEAFDGRMKTISFQVESGILYDRSNAAHRKQAKALAIPNIEIVVCNLYPFVETVHKPGVTEPEIIEQIDVGGPTMIRAAAKNFAHVLVITDINDYQSVVTALTLPTIPQAFRKQLAAKAFAHLSSYDAHVAQYLNQDPFPEHITVTAHKQFALRYGENPHQDAALYSLQIDSLLGKLTNHWGRSLSATNVADIQAGIDVVRLFPDTPAAVVIKHTIPCGIALGNTAAIALKRAIAADPESAFGGTIVSNRPFDVSAARVIGAFKDERKGNIDIIAVPEINAAGLTYLKKVRKSMGIYTFGMIPKEPREQHLRFLDSGLIVQTTDLGDDNVSQWQVVTSRKPTARQLAQMRFAWKCLVKIKSNTIVIADPILPMTRGIGSGQTSRVRATRIALEQASIYANKAILASDSFFPFPDCVELAAHSGIGAIIQQGGSVNDKVVIAAAEKAGIPMVLSNRRAFWH